MSDSINEQRCEHGKTGPHFIEGSYPPMPCRFNPGPSVVTPPPTFDAMLRDPNEQFSDPTLTDAAIRYAIEGEPPMTDPYTWETRLCDDQGMVSNKLASQLVGGHPTTYLDVYDNLVQHHIYRGSCPRVTEPFACTGSMHPGSGHIRCTSPAHAHVTPDELDGGFVAERLDMPGVISQGETREDPSVSTDHTDIDKLREQGQTSAYMDPDAAFDEAHEAARIEDALATAQRWEGRASALDKALSAAVAELVGLRTEVDQLRNTFIGDPKCSGCAGGGLVWSGAEYAGTREHVSCPDCEGTGVAPPGLYGTVRSLLSNLWDVRAERDAALARAVRAEEALATVRMLHYENLGSIKICVHCHRSWPCESSLAAAVPVVGAEEPTKQATCEHGRTEAHTHPLGVFEMYCPGPTEQAEAQQ